MSKATQLVQKIIEFDSTLDENGGSMQSLIDQVAELASQTSGPKSSAVSGIVSKFVSDNGLDSGQDLRLSLSKMADQSKVRNLYSDIQAANQS